MRDERGGVVVQNVDLVNAGGRAICRMREAKWAREPHCFMRPRTRNVLYVGSACERERVREREKAYKDSCDYEAERSKTPGSEMNT